MCVRVCVCVCVCVRACAVRERERAVSSACKHQQQQLTFSLCARDVSVQPWAADVNATCLDPLPGDEPLCDSLHSDDSSDGQLLLNRGPAACLMHAHHRLYLDGSFKLAQAA